MTVVDLSTPGRLQATAAASFELARFHLAWAGIDSGTTHADHALRDVARQEAIFRAYYTLNRGASDGVYANTRVWQAQRWWRLPGKPAAAIPGTSNHGYGRTVDWQNLGDYGTARYERAAQILTAHGWNNREGATIGESWHWTHVLADDKQGGQEMAGIATKIDHIYNRVIGGLPGQAARQDAKILDSADGAYIVGKITALEVAVKALASAVASDEALNPDELFARVDAAIAKSLAELRIVKG